jgi:hypothetical protein
MRQWGLTQKIHTSLINSPKLCVCKISQLTNTYHDENETYQIYKN